MSEPPPFAKLLLKPPSPLEPPVKPPFDPSPPVLPGEPPPPSPLTLLLLPLPVGRPRIPPSDPLWPNRFSPARLTCSGQYHCRAVRFRPTEMPGPRRVEGPKPRKSGDLEGWDAQNFRAFFRTSTTTFTLSSFSWGSFRVIFVVFKALGDPQMCTFGVLGRRLRMGLRRGF